MFGKCWSIQYINHEAYELRDKIHMYFTTKAAMKAIHDWIAEMNEEYIDHITEEFLANRYYDEIYMSNDACFSIVHRIA